ncbi:sulfotransferase 1A1-like [Glandiceps talaboti]
MSKSATKCSETLEPPFSKTYYYQGRKDRLMPTCMNGDSIDALKDFEVRDDDVFVITWAKAGTTFILEIVDAILHRGDVDTVKHKKMEDKINLIELGPAPGIEVGTYKKVSTWPSPRQIQTHLFPDMMPPQVFTKKPKMIWVSRNPRDCAVSLLNWHGTVKFLDPCEWDHFVDRFMDDGQVVYGNWYEHTAEWEKYKCQDNFLHLKFEDIKKDRAGTTDLVAKFLGVKLTPEQRQKVIDHTDFKNMKEMMKTIEQRDVFLREERHWQRKGVVGDWKAWFTVAQNEAFEEYEQKNCKKFGVDFKKFY